VADRVEQLRPITESLESARVSGSTISLKTTRAFCAGSKERGRVFEPGAASGSKMWTT